METQANVAYNALIAGGASSTVAQQVTDYAVVDMYAHGVTGPSRIPGTRKK